MEMNNDAVANDADLSPAQVEYRERLQRELDPLFVPLMEIAIHIREQRLRNQPVPKKPDVLLARAARELDHARADSDDCRRYKQVVAAASNLLQWVARQPALFGTEKGEM
jgi:hypothetical protein